MKKQNLLLSMLLLTSGFVTADIKSNKIPGDIVAAFDQLHVYLKEANQYPTLVLVFLESILTFNPTPEQLKVEEAIANALQAPSLTPEKQAELFQQLAAIRLSSLALQDQAIVDHIKKLQKNPQIQVVGITMSPCAAADYFITLFKKFGITFSSLGSKQAITLSHNNAEGVFKDGILCLGLELPAEHALEALVKQINYSPKQIIVVTADTEAEAQTEKA